MDKKNEEIWAKLESLDVNDNNPRKQIKLKPLNEIFVLSELFVVMPETTGEEITILVGSGTWAIMQELPIDAQIDLTSVDNAINAVYKNMQYPFGAIRKVECGLYHLEDHLTHMALCEALNLEQMINRSSEWLMHTDENDSDFMEEALNRLHITIGQETYSAKNHDKLVKNEETRKTLLEIIKQIKAAWNVMYNKHMTAKFLLKAMLRGKKQIMFAETTFPLFTKKKTGMAFGRTREGWLRLAQIKNETYVKLNSQWYLLQDKNITKIVEIVAC